MLFRSNVLTAIVAASTIGVVVMAGSGCVKKKTNPPMKLAFVARDASDFSKKMQAGVEKFRDEKGIQIAEAGCLMPNATAADQNKLIDGLLGDGYHGIVVSVISPADQTAEINKANEQCNVACVDTDCPDSKRIAYFRTDNYKAGNALGDQIIKLLPSGGKIAVFGGALADNVRLLGVKDAIANHNIDIVAKKDDGSDPAKARAGADDVLKDPALKVNLMCGLDPYDGGAIAAAIQAANDKGKILEACYGDEDATLKGIEDGIISSSVAPNPFEMGYQSMKMLSDVLNQGPKVLPPGRVVDVGVTVVNADDVKQYHADQDKILKK